MKVHFLALSVCVCIFSVIASTTFAQEPTWKLEADQIWSREDGKATMRREGGVYWIEHTGDKDWAVTLHKNIPVIPGDVFRISAKIENEGPGSAAFTIGVFDGENKIINWTHGKAQASGKAGEKNITDEFAIPRGGATILPRLMGSGVTEARCSELKLEKLGRIELLDATKEIPKAGQEPINLVPKQSDNFNTLLKFQGKQDFGTNRGQVPRPFQDTGTLFNENGTWRVAAADGLDFNMIPLEPFKVQAGDLIFISLRINVDRGKPYLALLPWTGGIIGSSPFAEGTFRPASGEETGIWTCIHAYVIIPEGVDGMVPAVCCQGGAVFNIAEWNISRPSESEINPVRNKVEGYAEQKRDESFDRGLVAVRTDKDVYLGWRLLKTDKVGVGFNVFRHTPDGNETRLNDEPITTTTDFVDRNVPEGEKYRWSIRVANDGQRSLELPIAYESDRIPAQETAYRSISLKDATSFASIAFADLDGDGQADFVIKTPNANIDPWYLYWQRSPETYKLQAYKSDGTFLWEYDLGWGIERGIWYSPYIVADLDGDGAAEIAVKTSPGDFRNDTGRVYSGPEYLSILDGKTGKERIRTDWPERDGLAYNYSNRHQLCLAYLDGKTPCVLSIRGTYNRMTVVAYQLLKEPDRLEELWCWDNRWEKHLGRWGQGAHTTHAVDLDGDGRDEIVLGSIALDDDGSILWEQKLGHPDHIYVGDIDPSRDGFEVVLGIETQQRERNGVCMVDGKTGKLIWGLEKETFHIHSTGMVSDIDPDQLGCEIWSGEENSEEDRWLRSVKGEFLKIPEKFPVNNLAPRSVWWTDEMQRKMIIGSRPVNYPSFEKFDDTPFEGSIRLIADLYGDWREEVITSVNGEIRIYTTTIPAKDRRTTFLQDSNYRATMIESTMGYQQIPLPSLDLKKTSGK